MKVAEQNGTVFAEPGVPAGGKMKKKKKKKIKKLRTVKCEHSFNILLLLKKWGIKQNTLKHYLSYISSVLCCMVSADDLTLCLLMMLNIFRFVKWISV